MKFKKDYEIFINYRQFYLMDAKVFPDAPSDYTDFDMRCRIKAAKNIIAVVPERDMIIPVRLEISDSAPPGDDFAAWNHIAEASLDLPSGRLLLDECCGERIDEISITPGSYRIRAYYGNLDKLSDDEMGGEDHYKLVIWAARFDDVKVLKQYEYPNITE